MYPVLPSEPADTLVGTSSTSPQVHIVPVVPGASMALLPWPLASKSPGCAFSPDIGMGRAEIPAPDSTGMLTQPHLI